MQIDCSKNPDNFYEISQNVLNKHTPRKKKYIRGNHKPSKVIMQGTRFKNKFLKSTIYLNKVLYNKQRSYCASNNSNHW